MENGTDGWTASPAGSWLQTTVTAAPGGGTTSWHVPDTGSAATDSRLIMPSYGSLTVLPELAAFDGLPPRFVLRFEHYLNSACGRDGGVLARFAPELEPGSTEIRSAIEAALAS